MSLLPGIGSHQSARRATDDWLTPPAIIEALGPFDLDPCCPSSMPWSTATVMLTVADDGLAQPWSGMVWCNPPYSDIEPWLHRLAEHGNGLALIFARTETEAWQRWVWPYATSVLFIAGRLTFHRPDGSKAAANAGAPSALIAYGPHADKRVRDALSARRIRGSLVVTS